MLFLDFPLLWLEISIGKNNFDARLAKLVPGSPLWTGLTPPRENLSQLKLAEHPRRQPCSQNRVAKKSPERLNEHEHYKQEIARSGYSTTRGEYPWRSLASR